MKKGPYVDPKLMKKVEQVVRLIRSKGVGVYFVTQNPLDLPDSVLGQLGNRVQHALRAYTPRDQKAVKAAAETFRPNPALDVTSAITELGVGEALVSTLGEKGAPSIVERTLIRPPAGRLGPITPGERAVLVGASAMGDKYDTPLDRAERVNYANLAKQIRVLAGMFHMAFEDPELFPDFKMRLRDNLRSLRGRTMVFPRRSIIPDLARAGAVAVMRQDEDRMPGLTRRRTQPGEVGMKIHRAGHLA